MVLIRLYLIKCLFSKEAIARDIYLFIVISILLCILMTNIKR